MTGKLITTIKTAWGKALRDAGIPYLNFHGAGRHTFGTRAIDGGAPISALKEVMGAHGHKHNDALCSCD